MSYVYVGTDVGCLESGRPIANGETTDDADQRLIDAGLLIPEPVASDSAAKVNPAPVKDNTKETGADATGT